MIYRMRNVFSILISTVVVLTVFLLLLSSCSNENMSGKNGTSYGTDDNNETDQIPGAGDKSHDSGEYYTDTDISNNSQLIIGVNGTILTAEFESNSSAEAFKDLLKEGPLTVDMSDYGGFEKVGSLGTDLPRNDRQITTEPGDIILYLGNRITIYYDINSWSFTRLAKISGVTQDELKDILGSGDVTVTFSLG